MVRARCFRTPSLCAPLHLGFTIPNAACWLESSACSGRCWLAAAPPRLRRPHLMPSRKSRPRPNPRRPSTSPSCVTVCYFTLVEPDPERRARRLVADHRRVDALEDARATVGDGLRHVLKRSGSSPCQTAHAVIELYALPLPAAHLHLGPMTLRHALLTLAGPAWGNRTRMTAHGNLLRTARRQRGHRTRIEPPAAEAVQTFPLEPSVSGGQP